MSGLEDEDLDPIGSPDPMVVFEDLARRAGLLRADEALTTEMLAFATLIVDKCAAIADAYGAGDDQSIGSSADHIRAELYEH